MNNARNIAVFAVIVLIAIGSVIFFIQQVSRNAISGPTAPTPIARALINEVRVTVQGPIVANEQFATETLDVTATQRSLTANVTYPGQLVTSQILSNNTAAYNQLLGALLDAGFIQAARGRNIAATAASTCPQGLRFTYETAGSSGNTLTSLWASTCSTNTQSFNGTVALVNQLFQAQFPGFRNLNQQFPVLQALVW